MNKFYFFLLCTTLVSCASHKPKENLRTPAGGPLSSENFSNLPGTALYKGPFDLKVGKETRKPAKVYLPQQYEASKKWPLIVLVHGFSGTAEAQDTYLGLRFRTSLREFILLAPEGTVMPKGTKGPDGKDLSGNQFWNAIPQCCDFAKTGVDDTKYLLDLIDRAQSTYEIDRSRIYLIGHSNGGFMVNRLACEAGGKFAGVMSLAGGSFLKPEDCRNAQPTRYLQVHATDDKTIPYSNGVDFSGAVGTTNNWLIKNRCENSVHLEGEHDYVALIPNKDTTKQSWKNCQSGKQVSLWTIKAHEGKWHNPHIPLFNLNFMDEVLDYLMEPGN